jgi:hypothetical protein
VGLENRTANTNSWIYTILHKAKIAVDALRNLVGLENRTANTNSWIYTILHKAKIAVDALRNLVGPVRLELTTFWVKARHSIPIELRTRNCEVDCQIFRYRDFGSDVRFNPAEDLSSLVKTDDTALITVKSYGWS